MPITVSSPEVTGDEQAIMRMVLVLPAPFGPRKPNASPTRTSKSMALTAVNVAEALRQTARVDKDLVRWGHAPILPPSFWRLPMRPA